MAACTVRSAAAAASVFCCSISACTSTLGAALNCPDATAGIPLLAGAGVKGGRYYGTWPGLTNDLDSDLLVTTDYRSVLSEVVTTRFRASTSAVFPGFAPEQVGVMTSL